MPTRPLTDGLNKHSLNFFNLQEKVKPISIKKTKQFKQNNIEILNNIKNIVKNMAQTPIAG